MRRPEPPEHSFKTLTHAQLLVTQGDPFGAARLLRELLSDEPDHVAARTLLEQIDGQPSQPAAAADETAEAPPQAADAAALAGHFRRALATGPATAAERIRRLQGWLTRICSKPDDDATG